MKDDSGFTLLEVLIALQIVLVCMLFVFPCVHAMKVLSEDSRQTDDAMALYFLRRELVAASSIHLSSSALDYEAFKEVKKLQLHNGRLVSMAGYEIFFQNIDDASFYEKNNCIWVNWKRKEHVYEAILVCQ